MWRDSYAGLLIAVNLLISLDHSHCAVCPNGAAVGHTLGTTLNNFDTNINRVFLIKDDTNLGRSFGEIGCYGVVEGFQFRCAIAATGSLSFQVWRFTGTTGELIGKFDKTLTCMADGDVTSFAEFAFNHIPVQPGDRIAVQSLDNNGLISMSQSPSDCLLGRATTYVPTLAASPAIGTSYTLSGGSPYCIALQAIVGPGKAPTFDNLQAAVKLHENIGSGILVTHVRASDQNTISFTSGGVSKNPYGDTVRYSLPDGLNRFTIDSTTGIITTALTNGATFDYESLPAANKYYSLVVYAHDQDVTTEGNSASTTLTVSLVDINEEHALPNLPNTINIDAKTTGANAQVYQVNMTMADQQVFSPFKYRIVSNSQNDGAFTVDINTGIVTSTVDMSTKAGTSYVLKVSVEDGTYIVSGDLTINVQIVSNSPPTIVNKNKVVSVPENTDGSTEIFMLVATDPDGDKLKYSIKSFSGTPRTGENIFTIDADTGVVKFKDAPTFDYEVQQMYTLTLSATDSLNPDVTTTLTINIEDINESPICNPSTYSITIPESTGLNQQVLTLTTTDPDTLTPAFNDHSFTMLPSRGSNRFQITSASGSNHIYTSNVNGLALGADVMSENYIIDIRLQDKASAPYLTTKCTANITVTQVNTPQTVTGLPAVINVDAQQTYAGLTVYDVIVTPNTIQAIDSYTYLLDSIAPDDGSFLLDPVTGQVNASIDMYNRTSPGTYILSIRVTDRQGFTTTSSTLTINVINTKSAPTIDNIATSMTVDIAEDIVTQVTLFQIAASDADNDPILSYNIKSLTSSASDPSSYFSFDSSTGMLKTSSPPKFNAESVTTFTFVINVNDYLHTSVDKTLIINVVNINEPPSFNTSYYTINMDEERPTTPPSGPTEVINLLSPNGFDATDPEDGSSLTYSILPSTYSTYFSLDPPGNSLLVTGRLDVDQGQLEYVVLEILVKDQGTPPLQDKAILNITLNEINDNAPYLQGVPWDGYVGSVHENAAEGTSIFTVSATDIDPGDNGLFRYEIFGTNEAIARIYFQVDEQGVVSVKDQIDYEQYKFLEFQIRAIDTFSPYWYTHSRVNISIIDVNDVRPTFVREFFNLEVRSDADIGSHIATLLALDNDADLRGNVRYYFLQGDSYDYFEVDDLNGKITTQQKLQKDTRYSLYCFAQDRGSNKETSTVAIVRVDSYYAPRHLIAVTLEMSLSDYHSRADDFLAAFNNYLSPWIVKVESAKETSDPTARRKKRHTGSHTVVNLYALRDNLTDSVANVELPKPFVHRDELLRLTRKTLNGDPTDPLLTGDFANLGIIKVEPAYPIWWIDTIEGRVTIGMLCLLFLLLLASLIGICCCWRNKKLCFAPSRRTTKPAHIVINNLPPVEQSEFKLKYKDPDDDPNNRVRRQRPDPRPLSSLSQDANLRRTSVSHSNVLQPERPDSTHSIHSRIYPSSRKINNFSYNDLRATSEKDNTAELLKLN